MKVTITREQRDVLWAEIADYGLPGDPMKIRDPEATRERGTYEAVFILLDAIGWTERDQRAAFEITLTPPLVAFLEELRRKNVDWVAEQQRDLPKVRAGEEDHFFIGATQAETEAELVANVDQGLDVILACGAALSQVGAQ
jgi:hypothetical protein